MNQLLLTLFVLFIIFLVLLRLPPHLFQVRDYPEELVKEWAANEQFTIFHLERRFLVTEPFFWMASDNKRIYYIEGQDKNKNDRKGFIRFANGWFSRMTLDSIRVRWV